MRIYPKIDTLFVRDAAFKITDQLRNPVIGDIGEWDLSAIVDQVSVGIVSRVAETPGTMAEGIVARTRAPLFDARGNRLILKLKTCDFK